MVSSFKSFLCWYPKMAWSITLDHHFLIQHFSDLNIQHFLHQHYPNWAFLKYKVFCHARIAALYILKATSLKYNIEAFYTKRHNFKVQIFIPNYLPQYWELGNPKNILEWIMFLRGKFTPYLMIWCTNNIDKANFNKTHLHTQWTIRRGPFVILALVIYTRNLVILLLKSIMLCYMLPVGNGTHYA